MGAHCPPPDGSCIHRLPSSPLQPPRTEDTCPANGGSSSYFGHPKSIFLAELEGGLWP